MNQLTLMLSLPAAFDLRPSGELVAIVGGGGKTSLMFALARSLPGRVVLTTTTRIFAAQMRLAPSVCAAANLDRLPGLLDKHRSCLVVGEVAGDKALGVPPSLPGRLLARPEVDAVIVEADGSRMRPVKAPADHEPVVPPETTVLVPVVGIDALLGPVDEVAHRPEIVRRLLGREPGQGPDSDRLSPADIAHLLTHPKGGLKGRPAGARVIPLINKVERASDLVSGRQIARLALQDPAVSQIVLGAVRSQKPVIEVQRRVTAVVLAAGQSMRMGEAKQLLPWGDTTVLGQTLANLRASAVHQILVVTGHEAEAVSAIAAAGKAMTVYNPDFVEGEMLSSLATALRFLRDSSAAVLVVLADQPMVGPDTIDALLTAYWRGQGELIAPTFQGRRGNPVLIARSYFAELLALPSGSAPRELLRRHRDRLHQVAVGSDAILRDLDSPDDYRRWRPGAGTQRP